MQTKKLPVRRRLSFVASRLSSSGRHAISFVVPEAAISIANPSRNLSRPRAAAGAPSSNHSKNRLSSLSTGISFEVRPGEALALLGANGAGKSTLLRILATLLLPTRATLKSPDMMPFSIRARFAASSAIMPAATSAFMLGLTGRENLRFFGRLNHLSNADAAQRIAHLAEQFHLEEALDRQVRTLSSGTVQRLSLARALLHQPRVLLLDEPTRSLDAIAASEFRRFLKSEVLRRGDTSLLFASHTLPEVELLADRIAVIDAGRLLACDTLAALKRTTGTATLEDAFMRLTGRAPHLTPEDAPE